MRTVSATMTVAYISCSATDIAGGKVPPAALDATMKSFEPPSCQEGMTAKLGLLGHACVYANARGYPTKRLVIWLMTSQSAPAAMPAATRKA